MNVEKYHAKTLVRKSGVTLFAWTNLSFNSYQGCWHDCIYCDGKSDKYFLHDDFGTRVRVKLNADELLERYLIKHGYEPFPEGPAASGNNPRKKPDIFFFISGATDPYQPVEQEASKTRDLLTIAYKYGIPVHLSTKSRLVCEDLDLIRRINRRSFASVNFSITLADEMIRGIFEPRTSSTEGRFEAVKTFRDAGISSGVYMLPVLPYIGDTKENMNAIFSMAKQADAEFVHCLGLTLRQGRLKTGFMEVLGHHYPHHLADYERLFKKDFPSGRVDYKEFEKQGLVWPHILGFIYANRFGLGYAPKRYIPEGCIQSNCRVTELLLRFGFLNGLQGRHLLQKSCTQAAYFVESTEVDIFKLSKHDKLKLPIPKEAYPFIRELSHSGSTDRLSQLEEEVYQQLIKRKLAYVR